MEFRKMLMITLYAEQKKRHRFRSFFKLILFNQNYRPQCYECGPFCSWLKQSQKFETEKAMVAHSYSCLENPMDGGAWLAAVHGVTESWTRLSDFTSTFHVHALEKEMTTHSSVLPWRIPGTVEPGGLPSMGSHRVRHD